MRAFSLILLRRSLTKYLMGRNDLLIIINHLFNCFLIVMRLYENKSYY